MVEVSQEQIEAIVSEVVETLRRGGEVQTGTTTTSVAGVFNTADQAVAAAKQAQADLAALGFKKREDLIAAIRRAGLEHAQSLAELAVQDLSLIHI